VEISHIITVIPLLIVPLFTEQAVRFFCLVFYLNKNRKKWY